MRRRTSHFSIGCLFWILAAAVPEALDADGDIAGSAKDRTGGALVGARVLVLTPERAVIATTTTDATGRFVIRNLRDGRYVILAQYPPLLDRQVIVTIPSATPIVLDLVLEVADVQEDVVVTASQGQVDDRNRLSQPINVVSSEQVIERAKTVVAQSIEGETGVQLQRTSPGMAGIFVRGLTGNKVNVFIDGVRYSNGAQRGGVNTFLDLIDPSLLDRIEVLRGTSSAQYGSDALGGSVQFLTRVPPLSPGGPPTFGGSLSGGAETGHAGGYGNVLVTYSGAKAAVMGSIAGRKTGNYRPGGGVDSHAAVTRFFGLPSDRLYPERMPGTGFVQSAGQFKINWVPTSRMLFVASYVGTRQDGASRWDQLLGGDGNLVADLRHLTLDLFYARLERMRAGWFDHVSLTYSLNTQREERVNQGGQGDAAASIVHQPERTTVHGVQLNLTRRLSSRASLLTGGDAYRELDTSQSFNVNPATNAATIARPRVPDRATYLQSGAFAQVTIDAKPDRLTFVGAVRAGYHRYRARAADSPLVNGLPLWPDDALRTASATFRGGVAFTPSQKWTIAGSLSTGYRAPHMTDLGTLGLTGSGFEVAAPDLAGRAAFVGSTADDAAVSTGLPVEQVKSERNVNVDGSVRYHTPRARAELGFFVNAIHGNLQKQALILPAGAVGTSIGGQTITSQTAGGAVFVALSSTPVLVRANFDNARIWGLEWSGDIGVTPAVRAGSTFTYIRAQDTTTKLPPNIEGGTPAPGGTFWVRFARPGSRWWVEPYVGVAADQSHLSSLDLGDRRTGAPRTRSQIQNFFLRGATNRGWISPGPDGVFGTADDFLIATGETLPQIQDRVLGAGVSGGQLFNTVKGYAAIGVRVGLRVGRHTILVDAENLTDANYRGISWGMDAPGRGVSVRYLTTF